MDTCSSELDLSIASPCIRTGTTAIWCMLQALCLLKGSLFGLLLTLMSSEPQTGPTKSSLSSGYAGAREAIQSDSPAGRAALFVVGNWCLLGEVDLAPIYLA